MDQLAPDPLLEQPLDRPQLFSKLDTDTPAQVIGDQPGEGVAVPVPRILAPRSGRNSDTDEKQGATSPAFSPQELRILDVIGGSHGSSLPDA